MQVTPLSWAQMKQQRRHDEMQHEKRLDNKIPGLEGVQGMHES